MTRNQFIRTWADVQEERRRAMREINRANDERTAARLWDATSPEVRKTLEKKTDPSFLRSALTGDLWFYPDKLAQLEKMDQALTRARKRRKTHE